MNHFLEGEPSPGIAFEYRLAKAADPGDHRGGGRRRGPPAVLGREPGDPRGVAQKASVPVPTDAQLRDALKAADAAAVTAWNDTAGSARC